MSTIDKYCWCLYLLAGRLPVRYGLVRGHIYDHDVLFSLASEAGLPLEETTIAEALKHRGYATAMFGKWHLGIGSNGRFLPVNRGFDSWLGTLVSHGRSCVANIPSLLHLGKLIYFYLTSKVIWNCLLIIILVPVPFRLYTRMSFLVTIVCFLIAFLVSYVMAAKFTLLGKPSCVFFRDKDILAQQYDANLYDNFTLLYTKESLDFIDRSHQKQSPFFLYVAFNKLHPPVSPSYSFKGSSNMGPYQDSLIEIDWSVGKIVNRLQQNGIDNETVVIFISDNGPQIYGPAFKDMAPPNQRGSAGAVSNNKGQIIRLRGSKMSNWEGGIRVPGIIRWPGKLPQNSTIKEVTSIMDIMPTILEIVGLPLNITNSPMDGKSLLRFASNVHANSQHKALFHYCEMSGPSAVTYGQYKLHVATSGDRGCGKNTLQTPLLYDIHEDPGETTPLCVNKYNHVVQEILHEITKHQRGRDDSGWSQFDMPMWPWLFPCANFPSCKRDFIEKMNFDDVLS
ncbi:arylsulfatase-like [Anneissia japonica]|uniref:arylsulfatase-like n=1 Tax=Anneissia japonica TaxID=1529436 RepID=UPI001425B302|nr:arylsulfatase-like [Anneissia japonica]